MEYIIIIIICSFCLLILLGIGILFTIKDEENTKVKQDVKIETSKQLNCTVNLNKYTCSDPSNTKIITLTDGPIFKISYSNQTDSFDKVTKNYYILAPYVFMVNTGVSLATKEISINSLQDLLALFDKIDNQYVAENKIPDKCLNVPIGLRNTNTYNTTCLFFLINRIDILENLIKKTFFPYINQSILLDYFNLINKKISENQTITVLEYVMYITIFNRMSKFKYSVKCKSDDRSTKC